jgi:uncharacterized protein with HEPN domain
VTLDPELRTRLAFLSRVVSRERKHLLGTDSRLFQSPFTTDTAQRLEQDIALAERVEAFVGRFGRLQDTLRDKLLPLLLHALGERTGAVIDNLDRAEKLGFIPSVNDWLALRNLRNQMVHEYIEDPVVLANALMTAHNKVAMLVQTADSMLGEIKRRGWI